LLQRQWYRLPADTMLSRPVALVSGIGSLPIDIADNVYALIVIYRLAADTVYIMNHECQIPILLEFGPTM
jgi:hypothetical protein